MSRNVELAEVLATAVLLTRSVKRLQFLQHVIQRVNCCLQPAKSGSSGAGHFPGIKYSEYVNLYYPYPQNAGAIFNLHATCMYVMGPQITLHADKTYKYLWVIIFIEYFVLFPRYRWLDRHFCFQNISFEYF